ncbi:MAG: hypothetical protein K1X87_02070 [Dehalococcoidia bacterium]|nr:hypothetical protein [Dehalococcoidia bacterium]HRC62694.1 hypothetical protein [Dehalococcoidia bacterium]
MPEIEHTPRPPRGRGGQPGNLNAFKDGRYSRRLGHAFRMAPPGEMRDHVFAVFAVVVRLELARMGPHPTVEERVAAIERAIRRLHRAGTSRSYRGGRSPQEVLRWFHDAINTALTATPEPIEPAPPAPRQTPENEGNE